MWAENAASRLPPPLQLQSWGGGHASPAPWPADSASQLLSAGAGKEWLGHLPCCVIGGISGQCGGGVGGGGPGEDRRVCLLPSEAQRVILRHSGVSAIKRHTPYCQRRCALQQLLHEQPWVTEATPRGSTWFRMGSSGTVLTVQ